ncbi:MAG TPA: hypothetical protein VLV16_06895 [Gemmatimonadales bacterium]|nr:hypothetical protein [Gemmatimonadales bacterium]
MQYALFAFLRDSPVLARKGMAWVAALHGHIYYRRGCSSANRLSSALVYFRTERDAQRAGYHRSTSRGG